MYSIENTSFLLAHNYGMSLSPSSTLNAVNHLLCIYHFSLSFYRPETTQTIRLTLGLPLAFCSDSFLMLSTIDQTSPRLLPFPSSLFGDKPIIPTNYLYTCYSLLVGFIPLGNHHSQARIFKSQSKRTSHVTVVTECVELVGIKIEGFWSAGQSTSGIHTYMLQASTGFTVLTCLNLTFELFGMKSRACVGSNAHTYIHITSPRNQVTLSIALRIFGVHSQPDKPVPLTKCYRSILIFPDFSLFFLIFQSNFHIQPLSISSYHLELPNAQVPSQSRPSCLMGTMCIAVCLLLASCWPH